MSRSILFLILACVSQCVVARRTHSKRGVLEATGFGLNEAKEIATKCAEGLDPGDAESQILCNCHAVKSKCEGDMMKCCQDMTMAGYFMRPPPMPWSCAYVKASDTCEPMYPGRPDRKAKGKEPAPTSPPVNEQQDVDLKQEDEKMEDDFDDGDLELEEEEEEIPDTGDDKEGDAKEDTTDENGEHCEQIEDAGDRASCICDSANKLSGTPQEDKCNKLAEKLSSPWSCAVNTVTASCGPIAVVAPVPTQAPKKRDEPKPQPKDCTGSVEDAEWWVAHKEYYSTLFSVAPEGSGKHGGGGKTLTCKFVSKNHPCLDGSMQTTTGIPRVTSLSKKKGIKTRCGFDGKWQEPSEADRQTCAYPIVPKNLLRKNDAGDLINAGDKQNRVLTLVGDKAQVLAWDDGYNLAQLFVVRPDGLVRSLAAQHKCLSGMNPGNFIFTKSGYLEGYLMIHDCEKSGSIDEDQIWWLGPTLAKRAREEHKAGACATSNSCCSLAFAKTSKSDWLSNKVFGMEEAYSGRDLLTFPQIEQVVNDFTEKEYIWRADGRVEEKLFYTISLLVTEIKRVYYREVGIRSIKGVVQKPEKAQVDSRITESFNLVAENRPKVLSETKMSGLDEILAVVDFWKL